MEKNNGIVQIEEIPSPRPEDRLIGLNAVMRMTGRSRSSIYRDIERSRFPAPVKTGDKSRAWFLVEVQKWIQDRPRVAVPSRSA